MKAAIVYYSATGSCEKIAKKVHEGMTEVMETDLFYIDNVSPSEMENYDLIVIGGPVWHMRDPVNLRMFTYGMPVMPGKLCAMFATHGVLPAGFFRNVSTTFLQKQMTLIGWKDWYANVTMVLHMPQPYLTSGHPDEIDLEEARAFGKEIAEKAVAITDGRTDLIPKIPEEGTMESMGMWDITPFKKMEPPKGAKENPLMKVKNIRTIDEDRCTRCMTCVDNCPVHLFDFSGEHPVVKPGCIGCDMCDKLCPEGAIMIDDTTRDIRSKKYIDMDECIRCGICEENCPMHAIDFSVDPPTFSTHCEACDFCWAVCPTGALKITNLEECQGILSMNDEHDPMAMILDFAEQRGEFRRLIPKSEVGFGHRLMDRTETPRLVVHKDSTIGKRGE